jgi:hypothetical protein
MVELVLGHGERVVRREDELADLLVVAPDHHQQLAQVWFWLSDKFCNLEIEKVYFRQDITRCADLQSFHSIILKN